MQHTWSFDITLADETLDFELILAQHKKELDIFISQYFKKQGAVAEKVQLRGSPSFNNDLTGELMLEFDLIYFNACLNIHEQERDKMLVTFRIDQNNNKLVLTGENWPEREFDDI